MLIEVLLAQAFWLIGPAYAANAFPPLVGGRMPIDLGKTFRGRRLLGDGKTIEGAIAGIIFGLFYGAIQILVQPHIPLAIDGKTLSLITITPSIVILIAVGALAGDSIGSFIKRRLDIPRGGSLLLLDQLGFLLVSLILASLVVKIDPYIVLTLIILTPLIHWIANLIGFYVMKVKKTPW
jgi:CDP-2,3-bis-(O-geranylgeranyl)-sn-glycerol synthase